jgi:hypothetical protein
LLEGFQEAVRREAGLAAAGPLNSSPETIPALQRWARLEVMVICFLVAGAVVYRLATDPSWPLNLVLGAILAAVAGLRVPLPRLG